MPELPEVETTMRGVRPFVEGLVLCAVRVNVPKLRTPLPPELAGRLTGRRVEGLVRRAKYIVLELDDGAAVLIHLGMSGRFVIVPAGEKAVLPKHSHVELQTDRGTLVLVDPRRFGLFIRVEGDWREHALVVGLGPEPLEAGFTPEVLYNALQGAKLPVKVALMTNSLVVGVGNIYASESLFRAKISPKRAANTVTKAEAKRLHGAVVAVLEEAIKAGGSTLRDYARPDGQLGYFAHDFRVYGRVGQPCVVCGNKIEKAVQAQRATFWCPTCQR